MRKILVLSAVLLAAVSISGCKKFETNAKIVSVSEISLDYEDITILRGETAELTATITPANATDTRITWTTSVSSVATVENGVINALSRGQARITATSVSNPDKKATCLVTVVNEIVPVTGLSVSPDPIVLKKDAEVRATAQFTPSGTTQRHINWSTEDSSVATVDSKGNIKGVSVGETKVWATSGDNPDIKASATVLVVKPFESITITQPSPSATTDLGYDEGVQIKYTFTPADSRDKVKYEVIEGSSSCIEVYESGWVKAKGGYSSSRCTVRVSSVADPSVYADVYFKTYEAPGSLEVYHKGFSERLTMYIGAGYSQVLTVQLRNFDRVKPGTTPILVGTDYVQMSAIVDGTDITVRASQYASTCTSSNKVKRNVKISWQNVDYEIPFYISELDPFQPKIGDILYLNGSYIFSSDSGYRGGGIFDTPAPSKNFSSSVTRLGIIGCFGNAHLTDDPIVASYNLPGITAPDFHSTGLHGIAIPYNADCVYRTDNPYSISGSDFSDNCWKTIPSPSYYGQEIFSKDHDNIYSSHMPSFTGFDAGRIRYSSSTASKHLAFHNSVGLLHYNMARGDSHRIHQVLYVTSYLLLEPFGGSTSHNVYAVSANYCFGRSSATHINCSAPLDNGPSRKLITPWLFPTIADLKSVFGGSPTATNNDVNVGKTVVDRATVFSKAVGRFSSKTNASYLNDIYWTSQEYSSYDAMAVELGGSNGGVINTPNLDKNEVNRFLPIFYF